VGKTRTRHLCTIGAVARREPRVAPVVAARSGACRVARKKAAFENEHPPRGTPRRRNTERKTYLLPWGCHTIMELVLATLPVETTGVLVRTGATAERAAMVTTAFGCGNKWPIPDSGAPIFSFFALRNPRPSRVSVGRVYTEGEKAGKNERRARNLTSPLCFAKSPPANWSSLFRVQAI